jgi:2-methylisocitrate lyase-like PEP mutase family enzyme
MWSAFTATQGKDSLRLIYDLRCPFDEEVSTDRKTNSSSVLAPAVKAQLMYKVPFVPSIRFPVGLIKVYSKEMCHQAQQRALAAAFKKLHKPGNPLVVVNVWDAWSAHAAATVPGVKALATTSYAVAATYGLKDNNMAYEQNMAAVARVASMAKEHSLPLTVDFQDGYSENIGKAVTELIKLGVVGANIEDLNDRTGKLRPKEEAVQRIKAAVAAAEAAGLADFIVNARTDVVGEGGTVDEAIDRAKAFLDVGATTAFIWGGGVRGLRDAEVQKMSDALEGRLSVVLPAGAADGFLTVNEVSKFGVARINIGPRLQFDAAKTVQRSVEEVLST